MKEPGPDYIAVGHVTRDILPDGAITLGGTAAYSAVLARNLGRRAGLLTRCGADLALEANLPGVLVHRLASPTSTTFRNVYATQGRVQSILNVAEAIEVESLPESWKGPLIVHLGPVAQEVDHRFLEALPHSLIGVTPQGWMRQWDRDGLVSAIPWRPGSETLAQIDVLVVGETEMPANSSLLEEYVSQVKIVALTHGAQGSTVYHRGESFFVPAFAAKEVDPTGAGDVFAAAFLIRYHHTGNPLEAATFASCAASYCVEKVGLAGVPTAGQIKDRLDSVSR